MYLSRVEIDTKNRQKIRDLSHLGAYHGWIEQSFPDEIAQGERKRHLWRIDQLQGRTYLLLLSPDKPDLEKLEKYGRPGTAMSKDYEPFLNRLAENQVLRFRLTANPAFRGGKSSKHPGKIIPYFAVDKQLGWLENKAENGGFKLLNADVVGHDRPSLRKQSRVSLNRTVYEGVLQITDLSKFRNVLTEGLGREKAFGMGLMTVIPM